ncbi:MAG: pyridoxamine 5'-phosphate oxidase [Actinomycetota bacterium]|nr:pyridoxamine 5'-phosphate oxidase [Actinomycetota bacterium]
MPQSADPGDLRDLRHEYAARGLVESDLSSDPVTMFRRWLAEAIGAGIREPNAMVVSTVSDQGRPAARMVLLKGVDDKGFVFYTNYDSRKGHELAANPACALLFPWHDLERQVRIEGLAERVDPATSTAYFASRPRPSQLGAWASAQSSVVADRAELEASYAELERRFEGREVPCPPRWGGYVVEPSAMEFWQGRAGRMHDRLAYRRADAGWAVERLAP